MESFDFLTPAPSRNIFFYGRTGLTVLADNSDNPWVPNKLLVPSIGMGVRGKHSHFGYDASLNAGATKVSLYFLDFYLYFLSAKGQLFYHFSSKPNSFYAGFSMEAVLLHKMILPYPEFILGKEWRRDSGKPCFVYFGIHPPSIKIGTRKPVPSFNYGVCF